MSSYPHYNGLTHPEIEILDHLQEECAEVIQAIAKIKHHGFFAATQKAVYNNRKDLETELGHLKYWIDHLAKLNQISLLHIQQATIDKAKFLRDNAYLLRHVSPL